MALRALIVDDNPSNALVAEFILEALGVTSHCIHDPLQVMAALTSEHYDLALLDWMMPQLDGIELMKTIRQHPDLAALPLIMCTARASAQDRQRAINAGADTFLLKPLTLEKMQKALSHLTLAQHS